MELFIQNINELENVELLFEKLNEREKNKFLKYKFDKDRFAFLAGIYLIRKHVGSEEILLDSYKKPYIENALNFNISHSGDYTILATSKNLIGCDIEENKKTNIMDISNMAFCKEEKEYLKKNNYDINLFYKIWTAKESYMKMKGCGFYIKPQSFSVDIENLKISSDNATLKFHKILDNYTIATTEEIKD